MTGAFLWGKLPAHGDFVARGLTSGMRDEVDQWLAASLAMVRDNLGAAFDDAYGEAPPWRFAWRADDGWAAGAIAPSVDGVGRRYPLLIGLSGLRDEQVDAAAEALENLLYDALGEGWDADRLHGAAGAVAPEPRAPWTADEGWWTFGAEHFTEARLAGARPPGLMAAMLTRTMTGERERA